MRPIWSCTTYILARLVAAEHPVDFVLWERELDDTLVLGDNSARARWQQSSNTAQQLVNAVERDDNKQERTKYGGCVQVGKHKKDNKCVVTVAEELKPAPPQER